MAALSRSGWATDAEGGLGSGEAYFAAMPKMRRKSDLPKKTCRQCGRPMVWRKAWARTWDEVAYCSDRCRSEAAKMRTTLRNAAE